MSNLRNLNQQNPFMDFLASFNNRGADHPFFAAFNPEARDRGPPPSYGAPNNPPQDAHTPPSSDEDAPPAPPPPGEGHPHPGPHHHGPPHDRHHGGPPQHHRGGHCGRGGWGARGGRGGGRCGGGGGGGGANFGPWGMGGGMRGGGFDMSKIADFISHFAPDEAAAMRGRDAEGQSSSNSNSSSTGGKDFAPEADIFDTEDAFVVHVSLPGAKKEDVGVNWNADKSELSVAGVIYRPGEEEFLKTLALDERKVGVFERRVVLGSRQAPAQVDSEGIAAKMEDGILVITIPKTESFVDVKKVDIE